jgi:hypothetical protein
MAYQFEDSATLGTESNRRPGAGPRAGARGPVRAPGWRGDRLGDRAADAADCADAATGGRVQADAGRLPLADGCAAAVVIGDGPLFAAEAVRVMAAGAALVWSNVLGGSALFFVPRRRRPRRAAAGTRCTARRTEAAGPCSPCRLIPGLLRALLTR